MIVQALLNKNKKDALLQLPHITENHLRHFVTKKRNICDIKQFVSMKDSDRRSILRHLTNEQYDDIIRVCSSYPLITMDVNIQVCDDEDEQTITAGALVTVVVNLERQNLEVLFEKETVTSENQEAEKDDLSYNEENSLEAVNTKETSKCETRKDKNKKSNEKNSKSFQSKKSDVKKINQSNHEEGSNEDESGSDLETVGPIEKNANKSNNEEYFERFQKMQKKREKLETKAKVSHRVYCPYFPDVRKI